jgi:hypothetical protein
MNESEDFLAHYGVKGMKWGVRKDRGSGRGLQSTKRTKRELAVRKAREDARARRRQISDKKLNDMIDRLKKEKQLKDLVNEDLRPGMTFTKRVISSSGEKVAKLVVTGAGVIIAKEFVKKKWGEDKADLIKLPKK